jgi:SAM-dependent methyltransferase
MRTGHYRQGEFVNTEVNAQFPALYEAHHRLHLEDLAFWLELADHSGDPILELGCGAGRVLLPLVRSGRQVYGIDIDPGMLAILKQNLTPDLHGRVGILQSDIRYFRVGLFFPLIILPCNTYSTLPAGDRRLVLRQARGHLRPGGIFAISMPNPDLLKQLPGRSAAQLEEIFSHPVTGEPVQVSSAWKRSATQVTFYWHYDHLLPDGLVERLSVQVQHELAAVDIYRQEFTEAGFTSLSEYGDFDYSSYQEDSPYLILLAS